MIRRFGCIRLTAASHARTFVFADVKLTSLFPTGPVGTVTTPTSVNDFIKQHMTDVPLIKNDLTLTAWAALSAERKQTMMPADFDSFDGHPKLHQATMISRSQAIKERNKTALAQLKLLTIETLGEFNQITAAQRSKLDSGVLRLVNQTVRPLQDFFNPIVAAFKERVDTSNLTATVPKPYAAHLRMWDLTYRHPYGTKTHMLGKDRQTTLESILSNSFGPWGGTKELNPINYLIAAPRQGKSLMLAEVVAQAASPELGHYGVGISFNSSSQLDEKNIHSIDAVTPEFWGRVVHSLYLAMLPEGAPQQIFGDFKKLPFFGIMNCDIAHALAQKLKLKRVVIAADEISRLTSVMRTFNKEDEKTAMTSITTMYSHGWSLVCSGFTMIDVLDFETISDRRSDRHYLCTASNREEYALMKDYLNTVYPKEAFTPALRGLYEIVKSVPGYLGLWVEMKAQNIRGAKVPNISSIEDLVMPFVGNLEKELIANPKLFTDYWRAVANRQDNANELKVARDGVLKGLEKLGAVLPRAKLVEQQDEHGKKKTVKDAGRYYLSPLVITHPWLRGAREHSLIATAVKLLQQDGPWTPMEKGKALEAILVAMLALTAAYTNDAEARKINPASEVSVETLIKRLCGQLHTDVITHIDKYKVDERLPASFPDYSDVLLQNVSKSTVQSGCDMGYKVVENSAPGKAVVKDLSAFPAVWSEVPPPKGSVQGKRVAENVAELTDVVAASTTALMPSGAVTCDLTAQESVSGSDVLKTATISASNVEVPTTDDKAAKWATKGKQGKRLEENVEALNSPHFSVLSPQCPMNPGCDVALLFRVGERDAADEEDIRAKVLLLFETKYHDSQSKRPDTPAKITRKAFHALNGVSQYVNACNIRRVCFVYCNTAVRDGVNAAIHHSSKKQQESTAPLQQHPATSAVRGGGVPVATQQVQQPQQAPQYVQEGPFLMDYVCLQENHADLSEKPVDQPTKLADLLEKPLSPPENCTLNEIMRTLGERGCTSSLHTVWTEDGWRDLLDSLYMIVPDIDEESIQNNSPVKETKKVKTPESAKPVTISKKKGDPKKKNVQRRR